MVRMVFISSLFCFLTFASEETLPISAENSKKGSMSISASSGYGFKTDWGGDPIKGFSGFADISTHYYLTDNLSLGLETSIYYMSLPGPLSILLGPSIQYTFWSNDRFSLYSKLSLLGDVQSPFNKLLIRGDVGMDFYANSNISFGPYIRFTKYFQETILGSNHFSEDKLYPSVGGRFTVHF